MAFNVLATAQARQGPVGQCKLIYVSGTQLKLVPYNGNLIKIGGQLYQIPAAGITISNVGFSAGVLYYIYVYNSNGTLTLTGNQAGHTTSQVAGNAGTEVMTGAGNDGYSLVGMVMLTSGVNFVDQTNIRWVRSWFNDFGVTGGAASTTTVSTSSTALIELDANARAHVLLWAGEEVLGHATCSMWNNGVNNYNYCIPGFAINGGAFNAMGSFSYHQTNTGTTMGTGSSSGAFPAASDCQAWVSPGGLVSAGTVSFTYKVSSYVTIRK